MRATKKGMRISARATHIVHHTIIAYTNIIIALDKRSTQCLRLTLLKPTSPLIDG